MTRTRRLFILAGPVVFAVVAACVGSDPAPEPITPTSDASPSSETGTVTPEAAATPDDAGADADADAGPCDLSQEFDHADAIDDINTAQDEQSLRYSADENAAYFARGDGGNAIDIFFAKSTQLLGSATALAGVNGAFNDNFPSVTGDGTTIYFASNDGPDASRIRQATSNGAAFGNRKIVDGLPVGAYAPWLAHDEATLYFVQQPELTVHAVSRGPDGSFGTPAKVFSGPANYPVVTADGLTLYYWDSGALRVAKRSSLKADFTTPVIVLNLDDLRPSWVSRDSCRLVLWGASKASGHGFDVYVAQRPKR